MDLIQKKIEKYKKYVVDVYLEDDLVKKNKIDKKIDALIDNIYNLQLENDFYSALFNDKDPFVLAHIANVSFNNNYDLYKSLEILEKIKNNAFNLRFCESENKNRSWQKFFSTCHLEDLKSRIAFYEEISDEELFDAYFACVKLFDLYYQNYLEKKEYQQVFEKIHQLITKVGINNKKEKFFDILLNQSRPMRSCLYLIMTCYMMCIFNYNKKDAFDILSNVSEKDVPLVMWKLLQELIENVK